MRSRRLRFIRAAAKLAAIWLAAALVVVPAVMRSRQQIERGPFTRLGIRLHWQSDTPPQKLFAIPDPHEGAATPVVVRVVSAHGFSHARPSPEPPRLIAFDNAPDLFRGPPARVL